MTTAHPPAPTPRKISGFYSVPRVANFDAYLAPVVEGKPLVARAPRAPSDATRAEKKIADRLRAEGYGCVEMGARFDIDGRSPLLKRSMIASDHPTKPVVRVDLKPALDTARFDDDYTIGKVMALREGNASSRVTICAARAGEHRARLVADLGTLGQRPPRFTFTALGHILRKATEAAGPGGKVLAVVEHPRGPRLACDLYLDGVPVDVRDHMGKPVEKAVA